MLVFSKPVGRTIYFFSKLKSFWYNKICKMVPTIPTVRLNSGYEMPVVGLGTYARKADPGQFRQAVECALDAGYRHIDTASIYNNEEEVGEAINNKIKQGVVKREDLFVTTKLWNDSHAEKDVVPALKESLERLKLKYVDLYLIHWPVSVNNKGEDENIDHSETWRGMEQIVELGLARTIGVSNFNEQQLSKLLETVKIKPAVNQFEINPTFTAHNLVDYCKKMSIIPVAYTPLGLISEARPEFKGVDVIKTDPKLGEIAEKYNKSRAQIGLRYLVQRGIPVLPKSFTKSRIEENLNIFDFQLTDEEMKIVDGYNLNHRCVPGLAFKKYKNFPF
ncbi:PREDICTED: aldo-keto reductase AKR2E4-like [Papilio xuthus]|uniref:Aldo-keto reductase AKR2E4-like n=1 Tax=Papilio xuthus TaxID=66420 RepID=A0AAJ7E9A6_PAPXU|nr:PREDICTED: aldo-keto reductase AKR2E4-like [Papilio xuthus]